MKPGVPIRIAPFGAVAVAALLHTSAALGLTLEFAAPASTSATRQEALTSYRLPVGPWKDGTTPTTLTEGALDQTAWRIDAPGLTTLQLLAPLRDQISAVGFTPLFECETDACGGFDFRYGTEVLPEPAMHVDLGDFRYLAAQRRTAEGSEYLSLLVSRSSEAGFVQLIRVGATEPATAPAAVAPPTGRPIVSASTKSPLALPLSNLPGTGIGARLESGGAVALDDLVFPSGTAELAAGDYASLAELAAWLAANPARKVALVGHTDASGTLEPNVALSQKRAEAVRARLTGSFGIAADQVSAEGVGYLSPRASNLTDEGRQMNRRVEVMLTSTQ